jgi:hypothetical protein
MSKIVNNEKRYNLSALIFYDQLRTVQGANIGMHFTLIYAYIFCIISCCFCSPERPVVSGQARRVVVAILTTWGTLEAPKHLVQ